MTNSSITKTKNWTYLQVIYSTAIEELNKDFSYLSINFMPIKGAYLIATGLAEHIKTREMLDIDILVHPQDFNRVVNYFFSHSKAIPVQNYWPFEFSFLYNLGKAFIYVELHNQINYPERFILPPADLFLRAIKTNNFMVLPSPEDALLIVLCHTLVHIPFEINKTLFDEIYLISNQNNFCWQKFLTLTKNTKISQFIFMILFMYSKKKNLKLPFINISAFSRLILFMLNKNIFYSLPFLIRRILIDIPFTAKPFMFFIKRNVFRRFYCLVD
jgi:hypothetical protein